MGREGWIDEQLEPSRVRDGPRRGSWWFPAAAMPQEALYRKYPSPRSLRRQLERSTDKEVDPGDDADRLEDLETRLREDMRRRGLKPPGRILFDLVGAKLQRSVYSERQLEEVMTDFWFNHFNVFFAKGADRWLVGEYEREAIRPHVFGRFEDMLIATARHPAMLFYLDNWRNVAPASVRPRSPRRDRTERASQRGINENYARELLELHTLGVDGGYTQADVVEVARVFTGWSIAHEGEARGIGSRLRGGGAGPLETRFRPQRHDPGDKTVLGVGVEGRRGPAGVDEGIEVLRALARHPSTAHHLATKLAVAFAADEPPPALVAELERVFLETDGDLRQVTRALFLSPHFYDRALYGSKVKSPFQLVASALRVTDARVGPSRDLFRGLKEMGELPYMSLEPTGYPAASEDWTSSGGVIQRVNFAIELAEGGIAGVRLPDRGPLDGGGSWDAQGILSAVLPGGNSPALTATIEAEIEGRPDGAGLRALSLALGSPEFQHR